MQKQLSPVLLNANQPVPLKFFHLLADESNPLNQNEAQHCYWREDS